MQPPLFKPLHPQHERIRIDDIWMDEVQPSPGKTRKSIGLLGCIQPVTVRFVGGDKPYELCDGQDRIKNLKLCGIEEVDAVVLPEGTTQAEGALVGVLANLARRDNPIDEALKLQRVLDTGLNLSTLAALTGIPKATLEQRVKLLELAAPLKEAARAGKVSAGVALAITKLPKAEQTELETLLAQQGSLTAKDVKAVRRVLKETTLAELEEALFSEQLFASPLDHFKEAVRVALCQGLGARELVDALEEVCHASC
jgi:ParB-like chromosome segregation protein Spo0J